MAIARLVVVILFTISFNIAILIFYWWLSGWPNPFSSKKAPPSIGSQPAIVQSPPTHQIRASLPTWETGAFDDFLPPGEITLPSIRIGAFDDLLLQGQIEANPFTGLPIYPRHAENGDFWGVDNDGDGRMEPVYVRGYFRGDGTYVRSQFRASPSIGGRRR